MSEVKARPSGPRGRGSGRGGRGGFSSRGGRSSNRPPNGDTPEIRETTPIEDEGELGELKKHYASKLDMIKEMFPDWTDEDIIFALQETDGDLASTIDRISEGKRSSHAEDFPPELSSLILLVQATFLNGERSRRRPKIAFNQKPKTPQRLLPIQQPHRLEVGGVEAAMMVHAEVEAGAQIVAEEHPVAAEPVLQQMDHATLVRREPRQKLVPKLAAGMKRL